MRNDRFEWDDHKAEANKQKHGVSFEEASEAFDDEDAITDPDDRYYYGEERFVLIGMVRGRLLVVIYTERGDHIRIISARKANKYDWEDYLCNKAP